MTLPSIQRTPLFSSHQSLGAKFVEFGSWEMPVQYRGVIEEHHAVREKGGLFDVSHMGEIEVSGREATAIVQELTTNNIEKISPGQIQYSALCYHSGGVVDDVLIYKFSPTRFLFCVNATNTEKDFRWMQENIRLDGEIRDLSSEFAQIALQGPNSFEILEPLADIDVKSERYYRFSQCKLAGKEVILSRTGYTGELGFEIYCGPTDAPTLWDTVLEAGRHFEIQPIGLGARDTLRLEVAYALYGHELTQKITPLEAGLKWIVDMNKASFIGKDALEGQLKSGLQKKLCGFEMIERGIPRQHYPIVVDGRNIGEVTSGTMSPTLKKAIGLGYVESEYAKVDTRFHIEIRGRPVEAVVIGLPFVPNRTRS